MLINRADLIVDDVATAIVDFHEVEQGVYIGIDVLKEQDLNSDYPFKFEVELYDNNNNCLCSLHMSKNTELHHVEAMQLILGGEYMFTSCLYAKYRRIYWINTLTSTVSKSQVN